MQLLQVHDQRAQRVCGSQRLAASYVLQVEGHAIAYRTCRRGTGGTSGGKEYTIGSADAKLRTVCDWRWATSVATVLAADNCLPPLVSTAGREPPGCATHKHAAHEVIAAIVIVRLIPIKEYHAGNSARDAFADLRASMPLPALLFVGAQLRQYGNVFERGRVTL
jgi:hypothetical protein